MKNAKRVWFIKIGKERIGPYSAEEVVENPLVTLETHAWKDGFDRWLPLSHIWELKALFEKKEKQRKKAAQASPPDWKSLPNGTLSQEGIALDLRGEKPPSWIWILFVAIVILYFLIRALDT